MKGVAHALGAAAVAGAAFWAYQVNYATQAALDRAADLRRDIARERDAVRVLEAEWAWLNAPDRLRALVEANAEALALEPLRGAQYVDLHALRAPRATAPADATTEAATTEAASAEAATAQAASGAQDAPAQEAQP